MALNETADSIGRSLQWSVTDLPYIHVSKRDVVDIELKLSVQTATYINMLQRPYIYKFSKLYMWFFGVSNAHHNKIDYNTCSNTLPHE